MAGLTAPSLLMSAQPTLYDARTGDDIPQLTAQLAALRLENAELRENLERLCKLHHLDIKQVKIDTHLAKELQEARTQGTSVDALFLQAAHDGRYDFVRFLLTPGAQTFGACFPHLKKALREASENGHDDTVRFLLEKGADTTINKDEKSPLQVAWERGHHEVVRAYFKPQGAPSIQVQYAKEAYVQAAADGTLDFMVALDAINPQIKNFQNRDKVSPLDVAAAAGHLHVVSYLVKNGASVDPDGGRPLHLACYEGKVAVANFLLRNGAVLSVHTFRSLCDRKSYTVLKEISKHPSVIQQKHAKDQTLLHLAATRGDKAAVQILLDADADQNAQDTDGKTPLHLAKGEAHTLLKTYTKPKPTPFSSIQAHEGDMEVVPLLSS